MASENETVADVIAEFGKNIELMRKCKCVGVSLWNCLKYKLRIEAAHNREIAAKDAEIERLKACRDGYCERIRLGAEPCKGCHVRIAQDEIAKLRALVGKLADAASDNMTAQCLHCDLQYACHEGEDGIVAPCSSVIKLREALKKAREEARNGER